MSKQEINQRIDHYKRALEAGKITAQEFDGFIEALARIAGEGA